MKRLLFALLIATSCAERHYPIYPEVEVEIWNIDRVDALFAFAQFLDENEVTEYVEEQLFDSEKREIYDSTLTYRVPSEWGIAMKDAAILPSNVTRDWLTFLQEWIDSYINN